MISSSCFSSARVRFDAALEDLADAEEHRLVVLDHAGGRRDGNLAVGEDVELLDDLLGFAALRQVDEDLDLVGGVVVDVLDLDPALGVGGEDRLDQRGRWSVPKGISVMASRYLLRGSIRARIFTLPPRSPSLYSEKSAMPPVGKSG